MTAQTRSQSLNLINDISVIFSLMTREKSIVNNVGWKIPNGNNARESRLGETKYTGN